MNCTNIPQKLSIDGFDLTIRTQLNRNLMPSSTPGNLVSIVTLTETSKKTINKSFELQSFKIFASEGSWQPSFLKGLADVEDFEIARVSNDGPLLNPDQTVDVVAEFKSLKSGKVYEILSSMQKVGKTE